MNILYIYDNKEDKDLLLDKDNNYFFYQLNIGEIFGQGMIKVNNSRKLNSVALRYAKDYSNFIFSINSDFLRKQIVKKDLSLYFISDLACKRTEQFHTYSDFCNSIIIKDIIEKHKIEKIVFDGCRASFIDCFKPYPEILLVSEVRKLNDKSSYLFQMIRNGQFFLKILIAQIFDLSKKKDSSRCIKNQNNKIFLTRYPKHLDRNLNEDKYASMVKLTDNFLINFFTDNFHQKVGLFDYFRFKRIFKDNPRVIVLDSFIKIKSIFSHFFFTFFYAWKISKISKINRNFNGINLTSNIRNELLFSISRTPRLLMIESALEVLIKRHDIKQFVFGENQNLLKK